MSQKIPQIDDDTQVHLPKIQSMTHADQARRNLKATSNNKNCILYSIIVMVVAIVILFTFNLKKPLQSTEAPKETQCTKTIKQLKTQIKKFQISGNQNYEQINILKKKLQKFKGQSDQVILLQKQGAVGQKTTKNGIKQAQKQGQKGLKKQQINKQQTAKNTIKQVQEQNNKQNQQFSLLLNKRKQLAGKKQAASKTVSQIKYLIQNKDGQTIDEVLYSEQKRKNRQYVHEQRIKNFKQHDLQSAYLATFNMKLDNQRDQEQDKVEAQQYKKLQSKWHFKKYKEELPMCVIVPGFNNNQNFRIQYNLNSIFQQNYTNYFVVIINDASTDGSSQIYRKYLQFYQINKSKYMYIQNSERKSAVNNIYLATMEYCSHDSIILNVDADDQLIGKNVMKIFNAAYQRLNAGVIYSNFYFYKPLAEVWIGFTSEYTGVQKRDNLYRTLPLKFSHLQSFRKEIFMKIQDKDFKDKDGEYFKSGYNLVIYFPLMELSCQRVYKIDGFHYLYNQKPEIANDAQSRSEQIKTQDAIRNRQPYYCYQQFNKKMNNLE